MKNLFKKTVKISIISLTVTAFVTGVVFLYLIKTFSVQPSINNSTADIIFNIAPGESLGRICKKLREKELITSSLKFKILTKFKNKEKRIQAGEYILSPSMTPEEILSRLVKGKVNLYKTTIPEGYSIAQIGAEFEKNGICKKSDFLKKAHDKKLVNDLSIRGLSFEGYLFPETYFFRKNSKAEDIIKTMVARFFSVYSEDFKERAIEIGFSNHEVITLASIIEKETGAATERELISSVFHNRLKKNMRLETDPTVIYGLKNFNGNITRKDLRKKTPYNTYIIKGLPPGPIASPGKESLFAALYPAQTDFLFFVSKKDGTHYFSKSLKEHNRAVRKYQLGR